MAVEISGVAASLGWGYLPAATLGAWRVRSSEAGARWDVSAAILSQDTFRVAQRPLVFEAAHAQGVWKWPVLELQVQAGTLTAILGPCEG